MTSVNQFSNRIVTNVAILDGALCLIFAKKYMFCISAKTIIAVGINFIYNFRNSTVNNFGYLDSNAFLREHSVSFSGTKGISLSCIMSMNISSLYNIK